MPEPPPPGYTPHPSDTWTITYHGIDAVAPTPDDVYRSRRGYYASTSYIDDNVGELRAELARMGFAENTVVVFTSDHGDQCGEHGMWFKRTCREWSVRVPLLAAGPRIPAGRRVDANVSLLDLYPTFVDLAGERLPAGFPHRLDGASLAPFLRGEHPAGWRNAVIIENQGEATIKPIRALVQDQFKYYYVHERADQLYDLSRDPGEWRDLAGDPAHAEVVQLLRRQALLDWDPDAAERGILASQRLRSFLKEALFKGRFTSWDYQPVFDASRRYVRRTTNRQWDPNLIPD